MTIKTISHILAQKPFIILLILEIFLIIIAITTYKKEKKQISFFCFYLGINFFHYPIK